jgi:hypothetical protein
MKKVLGIIVLVLVLSLVSVPALAQTAELSLKYWHAGVGGADQWVADYQVSENVYGYDEGGDYEDDYFFDAEKLILQPGIGASFILSGSYFLSPSASVGISYWGLKRSDTVGVEFIDEYDSEYIEDGEAYYWLDRHHWLTLPWWEANFSFDRDRWDYAGSGDFDGKGVLAGEGSLSMSAIDIFATKTIAGSDWEVGLLGGARRAVFNQHQSTALELSGGILTDEEGFQYVVDYYNGWYQTSEKWNFDLDSSLNIAAIGPQVGIEGKYALGNKLVLKAGAKAGILFGTAASDATWGVSRSYYEEGEQEGSYKWNVDERMDVPYSAVNSVQISTYDLSTSLGYQITEQLAVEAGYYASLWKDVPSLYFLNFNGRPCDPPFDSCNYRWWTWDQPEARNITVSGLTVGASFKF